MELSNYDMIFKRKSFHLFKETQTIEPVELEKIKERYLTLSPLISDIKTAIQIVPASETTCRRGEEYCILLYSEKKGNYLQNIGYLGEQLDLYLASRDIGALWFGIGKIEEQQYEGLDFVIMIAIAKVDGNQFRKDMFKSKRKPFEEIWLGNDFLNIGKIARYAPSACNTQPWIVETKKEELSVYRYKKSGKRGIMPMNKVMYYNRIDIGIFLCVLEICLEHNKIDYHRVILDDFGEEEVEKTLVAKYTINREEEKENEKMYSVCK